jgi:hypothetical protein
MWTRTARVLAAALLALALSACGGDETASDPRGDDPVGGSPSGSPTASPTDTPTTGTYPEYEPDDYEYTLLVTCFCPDAGVPMRVTVEDGEVTEAVYARGGRGFDRGDPVPDQRARTINDIIAELNGSVDAADVRVEWPEGQDHPDEVSIDKSKRMIDEEIGYTISDVDPG